MSKYDMTYERDGNKCRADFDTETGELVIRVSGPDLVAGCSSAEAKAFVHKVVHIATASCQDLHREGGPEG